MVMSGSVPRPIRTKADVPAYLLEHGLNRCICEVGVRFGDNFDHLLTCSPVHAVAVDHWKDSGSFAENDQDYSQEEKDVQYQSFVDRFGRDGRVQVVRDFSAQAAGMFADQYFDFVYLDADHSYHSISRDIARWWPKLRPGGLLAGHDYLHRRLVSRRSGETLDFGVVPAVDEFVAAHGLGRTFWTTDLDVYPSWFLPKPNEER